MAKLDQAVVLYMPSKVLNPDGKPEGSRCGRCMMFMPDKTACTIVHIDGTKSTSVNGQIGVCGLYVGGMPMPSSDEHKPMPTVPRTIAGYIEGRNVPTHCGNCRNFLAMGSLGRGECRKVAGLVEEYGCCNQWETGEYT